MANVLAKKAGYADADVPYASLSTPPEYTATHIDFGFDKAVPILPTSQRVDDILNERDGEHEDDPFGDGDDDLIDPEDRDTGDVAEPVVDSNWRLLPHETTMQAFERLTQQQPWTPFWKQGPKTRLEEEELSLFAGMHGDYDINIAPRHPSGKGYQSFETRWNTMVATRYRMSAEGEVIQLIRRKNVQQLREQYHRHHERLGTAALADRARDNSNHAMNRTIQQVRRQVPAFPTAAADAIPVRYRQSGNMPAGMPMAFNAEAAFGRMINDRRAPDNVAVPWAFNNTTTIAMPLARMSPVVDLSYFKKRKYCVKCGWKRRTHDEWGCTFGQQCKMSLCGKCYTLKQHHRPGGFGSQCQEPTHANCIDHCSDWFEPGAAPYSITYVNVNNGAGGVEAMQTAEL